MFRYAACALTIVLLAGTPAITSADPAPKTEKAPVAKLTGPSKARVGEQLKYTTEGSLGNDIQFSISPPTTSFEPVKLLDGKDTPGVIFTPSRPGVYYLYVFLNSENKTGHTLLVLNVEGGNTPIPQPDNPDRTYFPLKDAIKADREKDAQTGQYIAQLEALIGQMDTMATASNSWEQFNKTFKDAATTTLEDKILNSRKAISEYFKARFPSDSNATFNRDLVKAVKNEVLQTIRVSK